MSWTSAPLLGATLLLGASAAHAVAGTISPDRFAVDASGYVLELPIESNRPLDAPDADVERIVVVIHGSSRNAGEYRQRVEGAGALEPGALERTLVVAPQFLEEEDVAYHGLASDVLYWGDGWRVGELSEDTSSHPRPAAISSFSVLDQLLDALIDPALFPNLAVVVLTGHSGGAQTVHRYAASTPAVDVHAGVAFRFVLANPGTYLYPGPERAAGSGYAMPSSSQRSACPKYDEYKYGVQDLFDYVAAVGASELVARYERREVHYLLGAEDTGSSGLDTSCSAQFQGAHRFERGLLYHGYLEDFYGPAIGARHRLVVVEGVGHSSTQMFQSPEGVEALFLPEPALGGAAGAALVASLAALRRRRASGAQRTER